MKTGGRAEIVNFRPAASYRFPALFCILFGMFPAPFCIPSISLLYPICDARKTQKAFSGVVVIFKSLFKFYRIFFIKPQKIIFAKF